MGFHSGKMAMFSPHSGVKKIHPLCGIVQGKVDIWMDVTEILVERLEGFLPNSRSRNIINVPQIEEWFLGTADKNAFF